MTHHGSSDTSGCSVPIGELQQEIGNLNLISNNALFSFQKFSRFPVTLNLAVHV